MAQDDGHLIERATLGTVSDQSLEEGGRQLNGVSFTRVSLQSSGMADEFVRQERSNIQLAESMDGVVRPQHRLREVGSCGDVARPVVDLLWAIVRSGEVDFVSVVSMDRLYRDLGAECEFFQHCAAHGVQLWVSGGTKGCRMVSLDEWVVGIGDVEGEKPTGGRTAAEREEVVRKIFEMIECGYSAEEIAELLNRLDG